MMAHFNKLQTRLGAVQKYPTTDAQSQRFCDLGWPKSSVYNLWELWSQSSFASSEERRFLDTIEPFDEWEEFALFGCHYFLLVADMEEPIADVASTHKHASVLAVPVDLPSYSTYISALYNQNDTKQGYRRFGAALCTMGKHRSLDNICVFGGMGTSTRLNSYDLYAYSGHESSDPNILPISSISPSSRMCHTVTDLGIMGSLLVGGRLSPDQGLIDCWLWHKWLNTWERVDDLPHPLYRHQAVKLGQYCVLVSGGRINSQLVSSEYYIWGRRTGWVKCTILAGETPVPTYGSVLALSHNENDDSIGYLAGGISADGMLQQGIWRWQVSYSEKVNYQKFVLL
jgi:tRNA wybutosine-synthesizing protein 4